LEEPGSVSGSRIQTPLIRSSGSARPIVSAMPGRAR
jgi:hypothetical protein